MCLILDTPKQPSKQLHLPDALDAIEAMAVECVAVQTAVDPGPPTRASYMDIRRPEHTRASSCVQECLCIYGSGLVSTAVYPQANCAFPLHSRARHFAQSLSATRVATTPAGNALEYDRRGGADLDRCEGPHGRGGLGRCEGRGRRESRGGSMATRTRRSCRLETLLTASTHTCQSYCQTQSVICPLTGNKRQAVRWRLSGRTCLCSTLTAYSTLPKPR
jgi:hypothetical protein